MKYIAIIDTDDYEDFNFFEDGNGKYLIVKDKNSKSEWMSLRFSKINEVKVGKWENIVSDELRDWSCLKKPLYSFCIR